MKFARGMIAVLAAVAFIGNVAVAKEVKKAKAEKAFCEKEGKKVKAKDKAACEKLMGMWKEPVAAETAPAAAPAAVPAPEQKAEEKK